MDKHDTHGQGTHGGYERSDAHAGATIRAGLYILGTMFLTALVVVPMYGLLGRREAAEQQPAASVLKPDVSAPAPSFPRLVTSEPAILGEFRAQEEAFLTSYGWVEKDRGIARMPIDEAMKIVAGRGLPDFAAPEAPGAPAGGAE